MDLQKLKDEKTEITEFLSSADAYSKPDFAAKSRRLAELDMKLRGAGDINGTQQSGMAFDLKIANPTLDATLLQSARDAAITILESDPRLEKSENIALRQLRARHAGGKQFDFSMIS